MANIQPCYLKQTTYDNIYKKLDARCRKLTLDVTQEEFDELVEKTLKSKPSYTLMGDDINVDNMRYRGIKLNIVENLS